MKVLLVFLYLCFLSYTQTVLAQPRPLPRLDTNQYSALKLLYDSTNGAHWTWNRLIRNSSTIWNFTSNSDPCRDEWQGLTCIMTQRPFVINRITLARYNLSGSIPAMFFENMRSLQLINFFFNQISGTLPSTVGILSNLELLMLERNLMSGTLPSTLGNLSSLQGLNLRFNGFSGTIPTTLGLLTNLGNLTYSQELTELFNISGLRDEEYLNGGILIAQSNISGTIPTELCNLFQMETLFLEGNYLVGTIPSEIGNLKGLQNMHFGLNSMTGTLPSTIGQLTNLRSLSFHNNSFTGSIPESFVNLTNLFQIIAFNNSLNSTFPSVMGNLTQLNYVQLYNNKFTGSLPDLSRLSVMAVFDIGINSLTGTIPSYVGNNWTRLTRFTLNSKGIYGKFPQNWSNLTRLNSIELQNCALTGSLPSFLSTQGQNVFRIIPTLTNLQALYLDGNHFYGKIPESYGGLHNLSVLSLFGNSLTGTMPSTLGQLPILSMLMVNQNSLNGTIPSTLGNLSRLQYLALSDNSFTGNIPSSLGGLRILSFLDLSNCFLDGMIPSSFAALTQIQAITLNNNKLTGDIPQFFQKFSFLTTLFLSGNNFHGSIPSFTSALRALKFIGLDRNKFTGSIPSGFLNLPNLLSVYLGYNGFTGSIPENMSQRMSVIDLSSNRLTGTLPASVFMIPSLKILAISKNCISANISAAICNATSLTEFYFEAVSNNCNLKNILYIAQIRKQTLPFCIWNLSSIKKLYLSGNNYRGSLSTSVAPTLTELSISYNAFFGTLPHINNRFKRFDISSNKLFGDLDFQISPIDNSSSFSASVNRFSGRLYSNPMKKFKYLNILSGNLFACNYLPKSDERYNEYSCGSFDFDLSVYIWSSLLGALTLLCSVLYLFRHRLIKIKSLLYDVVAIRRPPLVTSDCRGHAEIFQASMESLKSVSIYIGPSIVVFTCAFYSGIKSVGTNYKTHKTQYLYSVSGLFLRTKTPATVLFVFFLSILSYIAYLYAVAIPFKSYYYPVRTHLLSSKSNLRLVSRFFAVLCFIALSLFMNALYIYASTTERGITLLATQMSLIIFNFFYALYALPTFLTKFFANNGIKLKFILMYSLILGVLDMIIPLVATLFTDPLCFDHFVISYPESTMTYSWNTCSGYTFNDFVPMQRVLLYLPFGLITPLCSAIDLHENKITFNPVPNYSSQCRNALFQNFLPIVMYSSIFMTIYRLTNYLYRFYREEINVQLSLLELIYSLSALFEEIALLVLYGTMHPLVATALSVSIFVHLNILKASILRFARRDEAHVDLKCQEALRFSSYVMWPPLIICSILYGLYLADMVLDNDDVDSVDIDVAISFLVLTISFAFSIRFAHFFYVSRLAVMDRKKNEGLSVTDEISMQELRCTSTTSAVLAEENLNPMT